MSFWRRRDTFWYAVAMIVSGIVIVAGATSCSDDEPQETEVYEVELVVPPEPSAADRSI